MKNALIAVLGAKPKKDEEEDDEYELSVSPELVTAAKAVRGAKSDEDYAKALKGFLKLCEEY